MARATITANRLPKAWKRYASSGMVLDVHKTRVIWPTPVAMADTLYRLYANHTNSADIVDGLTWYPSALVMLQDWAGETGLPLATVASTTAAISPQLAWPDNIKIARAIVYGYPPKRGALRINMDKARAIVRDRAESITPYFKHGPKVSAFARNLAGDTTVVTVDAHAAQAALDNPIAVVNVARQYARFADAYTLAADAVGFNPPTFQAIIWHTWKRLHSPESKRALQRIQR